MALQALTSVTTISCEQTDIDRYGRIVARCFAGGGDVGRSLVLDGWAIAYREFSLEYEHAEETARRDRRGMWAGEFIAPSLWRLGARLPFESLQPAEATDCYIKGNINAAGERIFHVPGGRFYAATRLDEAAGERWFCTEEQALGAGWRRSQE